MAADLILTNDGIQFASGVIVDIKAAMPTSGTYTAGSVVLELTSSVRLSGWKRLTTGAGHVLNTDWSYFSGNPINSGTPVATTSGTSIDFTGIPTGVRRVTVMLNGVSTNGTSLTLIQIGSGSFTTSGYASASGRTNNANNAACAASTAGFVFLNDSPGFVLRGAVALLHLGGNVWTASGVVTDSANLVSITTGGNITLGGVLDRLRLTNTNGTDSFDLGSANILWEF